jgi:hypothetical protein
MLCCAASITPHANSQTKTGASTANDLAVGEVSGVGIGRDFSMPTSRWQSKAPYFQKDIIYLNKIISRQSKRCQSYSA